jgi:hypothetical protein
MAAGTSRDVLVDDISTAIEERGRPTDLPDR